MSQDRKVRRGAALYITVPQDIAFDARRHDCDPFEVAIIGGILTAAHMARGDELHAARFAKGALAIKKELELAEKHKGDWQKVRKLRRRGIRAPAPVRQHVHKKPTYKTGRHSKNLKGAGAHAYQNAGSKQHANAILDTIRLGISKSRLLALSGISRDGQNLGKLAAILKRLTHPIKVAGRNNNALLSSVDQDPAGRLTLEVSGDWFAKHYIRVPLPLPTRSRQALSLYLFSFCVFLRSREEPDVSFMTLCERIGISRNQFRQRSFDRALKIVNETLSILDDDALHHHRISVPGRLEVDAVGTLVRLRGVPRSSHPDEMGYALQKPVPGRQKRLRAPDFAASAPNKLSALGLAFATSDRRAARAAAERQRARERAHAE